MSVRLCSADRRWQKAVAVAACFSARRMLNVWSALEGRERVGRGLTPRGSGRGRPDRPRQVAEEDGVGAGAGEGYAHPAGGLGDAGGDLQEPEPDRREFGLGESMCLGKWR